MITSSIIISAASATTISICPSFKAKCRAERLAKEAYLKTIDERVSCSDDDMSCASSQQSSSGWAYLSAYLSQRATTITIIDSSIPNKQASSMKIKADEDGSLHRIIKRRKIIVLPSILIWQTTDNTASIHHRATAII